MIQIILGSLFIMSQTFLLAEDKPRPKVVIVGAGIAGLTTAYRLQQANIDVEVFEARNHVGERIFSA
jgi:monoamine oxidase